MAVVLPRKMSPEERRRAMRVLTRVKSIRVAGGGVLNLERLPPDAVPQHNLRCSTWTGPSRCWASVTPLLLDRFPRKNTRKVEDIVATSCEYVGLPRPEVLVDRHSPLHGVEPSFRFVVRRGNGPSAANARLYTHVWLAFEQEVQGPVLLGAGRYFGLGLLRPIHDARPLC
jgi:CRISPR-associated protein Csb2